MTMTGTLRLPDSEWRRRIESFARCDFAVDIVHRRALPADVEVRIPIEGAESLNVAMAGSIALYEWRRQNPQP